MITKKKGGAYAGSTAILLLTGGFLFYALTLTKIPLGKAGNFHAIFSSANGLSAGDDVVIGGVRVGRVNSIRLDAEDAVADVSFSVQETLSLPEDSAVSIGATSMMGGNALQIIPGKSSILLKSDQPITNAHPMLSLEQQISNYIFGAGKL